MYYVMCLLIIFSSTICYAGDTSAFSIYLSTESSDVKLIPTGDIDKIKLRDEPIITMDDVISYSKRSHIIELSPEAYNRFMRAHTGTVFVVCVGKERIFAGAIWSELLSSSCPGVVVLKFPISGAVEQYPDNMRWTIRFRLGYPTEEYFEGKDKRSEPRIISAFKNTGKLRSW